MEDLGEGYRDHVLGERDSNKKGKARVLAKCRGGTPKCGARRDLLVAA